MRGCQNRRVRVFWYASGRLRRVYDESLSAAAELQRSDSPLYRLDPIDFGRRVAAEKELLGAEGGDGGGAAQNAVFDDSGHFLIYATLLGIKARYSIQLNPLMLLVSLCLACLHACMQLSGASVPQPAPALRLTLVGAALLASGRGLACCAVLHARRGSAGKHVCGLLRPVCAAVTSGSGLRVEQDEGQPERRCQHAHAAQVVNLVSNRVARILGKVENTERFLRIALYQGIPGAAAKAKRAGAGRAPVADPTLVATAAGRPRLFLFSRREPDDAGEAAAGRRACPLSTHRLHHAADFSSRALGLGDVLQETGTKAQDLPPRAADGCGSSVGQCVAEHVVLL